MVAQCVVYFVSFLLVYNSWISFVVEISGCFVEYHRVKISWLINDFDSCNTQINIREKAIFL